MISRLLGVCFSTKNPSKKPAPFVLPGDDFVVKLKPMSTSNNIKIIIGITVASIIVGTTLTKYLMKQAKAAQEQKEKQFYKSEQKEKVQTSSGCKRRR